MKILWYFLVSMVLLGFHSIHADQLGLSDQNAVSGSLSQDYLGQSESHLKRPGGKKYKRCHSSASSSCQTCPTGATGPRGPVGGGGRGSIGPTGPTGSVAVAYGDLFVIGAFLQTSSAFNPIPINSNAGTLNMITGGASLSPNPGFDGNYLISYYFSGSIRNPPSAFDTQDLQFAITIDNADLPGSYHSFKVEPAIFFVNFQSSTVLYQDTLPVSVAGSIIVSVSAGQDIRFAVKSLSQNNPFLNNIDAQLTAVLLSQP